MKMLWPDQPTSSGDRALRSSARESPPAPTPASLSWSHTRHRTLECCERRYFYQYYGSTGGWSADAPPEVRRAYALKQMTSLPLVLGSAVHRCARALAQAAQARVPAPTEAALRTTVRRALNACCRTSRHRAAYLAAPRAGQMLHEVYYGLYYGHGIPPTVVTHLSARLDRCVAALVRSPLWDQLRVLPPSDIVLTDQLATVLVDAVPIYVAPDLVYRTEDRWVIVDWKTGMAGAAEAQLALYGLYLEHGLGVPWALGRFWARVVALSEGAEWEYPLDRAALDGAAEMLRRSLQRMRGFLVDESRNIPRDREAFARTADHRRCARCQFLELCWPGRDPGSLGRPQGGPGGG